MSGYHTAFILIIIKMNEFMSTTSHNAGEIESRYVPLLSKRGLIAGPWPVHEQEVGS